jgi:hypothetical protein
MAPVGRHKIEHTARHEGKRDRIGARHPLAMHGDLAVARGNEGGGGADHPRSGLHGGSGEARTAGSERDPGEGPYKDAKDIDAAEDAMELQVALAKSCRELDGTGQQSDGAAERMRDEKMPSAMTCRR